jgi:hypothetical protein
MNPLFREAVTAYLRSIGVTFTLADDGTLTVDRPLTGLEAEQLAKARGETLTIKES